MGSKKHSFALMNNVTIQKAVKRGLQMIAVQQVWEVDSPDQIIVSKHSGNDDLKKIIHSLQQVISLRKWYITGMKKKGNEKLEEKQKVTQKGVSVQMEAN